MVTSNMNSVVIGICIVTIAVIVTLLIYRKYRKKTASLEDNNKYKQNSNAITVIQDSEFSRSNQKFDELVIQTERLPAKAIDESKLIEITDSKILTRVNNLIPGFANAGVTSSNAVQAAKSGNEVYCAIIPTGSKLTNSKTMKGAVRGFYRCADGIQGHANFVEVQTQKGTAIAANTLSTAMLVSSIVVGQYYMTQINTGLEEISDNLSKIYAFQDNEFRSRIISLINQVKKIACFHIEILENDEVRQNTICQLNRLEEECDKLLCQVNLTLSNIAKINNRNYTSYEKKLKESHSWYMYQNTLLDVLYRISDLSYTLYKGTFPREACTALLPEKIKQVKDTKELLTEWHNTAINRFGIDIDKIRRKRTGFNYFIHSIPILFKNKHKFRSIDEKTVNIILAQTSAESIDPLQDTSDLYAEDVQLISKDGKIYYLPQIIDNK